MNQEYQLNKLKEITGHDFRFVSDKDNKYGVKYYVLHNENAEENNIVLIFFFNGGFVLTLGKQTKGQSS